MKSEEQKLKYKKKNRKNIIFTILSFTYLLYDLQVMLK